MFGIAGIGWSFWWESLVKSVREEDPDMAARLEQGPEEHSSEGLKAEASVPWRAFLRNSPIRALAYVHFCNNW